MRGAAVRPIVVRMDTWNLHYRQEPPRLHAHWVLLIAALASLAMLGLACMLADPGALPLR